MTRQQPTFDADCGDGRICSATFSPDRVWRYELRRIWDSTRPLVAFVGLNPTRMADETHDDRTIRRCITFAKDWGYGGLVMLNAFAFRDVDPRVMEAASDPVGPENDRYIRDGAAEASLVVVAWGARGHRHKRSTAVLALLGDVHALGFTTKHREPRHPLYLRANTTPISYVRPRV